MDILNVLLVIIGFAFIIFIHELGHFIFSKLLGFKVEEFAIGFGKPLLQKQIGETLYSIRAIPLGGYNKLPDIDSSYVKEPMSLKFYLQRFAVSVAGGLFNIISAYIVILLTVFLVGIPTSTPSIKAVHTNISDQAQMFQVDDKIISVNGTEINDNMQVLSSSLQSNTLDIVVNRNEENVPIHIEKEEGKQIGIEFASVMKPVPKDMTLEYANTGFKGMVKLIFSSFDLITKMPANDMVKSVSGPVGISVMMFNAQQSMGFGGFCMLFALISINIGILNLMPIPLMDGGRILVDTVQFATRNLVSEKGVRYIEYTGLACIGLLFSLGLLGDFYRLVLPYL